MRGRSENFMPAFEQKQGQEALRENLGMVIAKWTKTHQKRFMRNLGHKNIPYI